MSASAHKENTMAAAGTPQHMNKGKKGSEKKDVPLPIHGHHHGKDQLGHSHGKGNDLHHKS
jgi:hypothetical protein